jgi:hypothetical protein
MVQSQSGDSQNEGNGMNAHGCEILSFAFGFCRRVVGDHIAFPRFGDGSAHLIDAVGVCGIGGDIVPLAGVVVVIVGFGVAVTNENSV